MCDSLNKNDDCKISLCKAEIQFIIDILPEGAYKENDKDVEFFSNKDGFYDEEFLDYEKSHCAVRLNRDGSPMDATSPYECCSKSPTYFRFKSQNKSCCNNVTYDVINSKCEDGSVLPMFV